MKFSLVILFISATLWGLASWFQNQHLLVRDQAFVEKTSTISPPNVKILEPKDQEIFSWNAQIPYSISVSDSKDGESNYGEINAAHSLLEVSYIPMSTETDINEKVKAVQRRQESRGLRLMRVSTCLGCHGDKIKIAGPSFSELARRYSSSPATLNILGTHIMRGSTGIWGKLEMPAHPNLSLNEAIQMAGYMLEEGKNINRWVYPGLEGVVQTIEKPKNTSMGVYVLTASYISNSKLRGQHSIVLKIK